MAKGDKLTDKQQKFILEYCRCFNATRAAKQAGYKGTNGTLGAVGYENLRKPHIKAAIEQFFTDNAMEAAEVVSRLADQARSDLGNFADISSAADLKDHSNSRLVKKFKKRITTDKDGDTQVDIELELYDAHAALVDIGKVHGIFVKDDNIQAIDLTVKIVKGVSIDDL